MTSSSTPLSTGSTQQVSTPQHSTAHQHLLSTHPAPPSLHHSLTAQPCSTVSALHSEGKLHWDEVSDFLFDALSEQFHVQSETREEERIARLLTTLHTDCLERKDFAGLARMVGARRQVLKGRAETKQKVKEEKVEDDEEDWDEEEEWDEEEGEIQEEGGELEGRMDRMTVAEGKEEEEQESKSGRQADDAKEATAEQKAEAEDGWTTVGGKQKGKKKGR